MQVPLQAQQLTLGPPSFMVMVPPGGLFPSNVPPALNLIPPNPFASLGGDFPAVSLCSVDGGDDGFAGVGLVRVSVSCLSGGGGRGG